MRLLPLLAALSLLGVNLVASQEQPCENESDPDSGIDGNWYVTSCAHHLLPRQQHVSIYLLFL